MSQEIGIAPTHDRGFGLIAFRGWAGWASGALIALGGVEGEFTGGGVDDADVEVLGEDRDAGSADAEGLEPSGVAQGDPSAGVDAVGADRHGCRGSLWD